MISAGRGLGGNGWFDQVRELCEGPAQQNQCLTKMEGSCPCEWQNPVGTRVARIGNLRLRNTIAQQHRRCGGQRNLGK